jgi:hypothetical protein
MSEEDKKIYLLNFMTNTFKEMYDAYNACTSKNVKSALNDAMITYAKEVRTGYAYYDMDMYTSLYKCAETSKQGKNALEQADKIIADPALDLSELRDNFKEFLSLKSIIKDNDLFEFDLACTHFLIKFRARVEKTKSYFGAGMADFSDNYVYETAKEYLKESAKAILDTGLDLESCYLAKAYIEKY